MVLVRLDIGYEGIYFRGGLERRSGRIQFAIHLVEERCGTDSCGEVELIRQKGFVGEVVHYDQFHFLSSEACCAWARFLAIVVRPSISSGSIWLPAVMSFFTIEVTSASAFWR